MGVDAIVGRDRGRNTGDVDGGDAMVGGDRGQLTGDEGE